jgi:hypothetical protein
MHQPMHMKRNVYKKQIYTHTYKRSNKRILQNEVVNNVNMHANVQRYTHVCEEIHKYTHIQGMKEQTYPPNKVVNDTYNFTPKNRHICIDINIHTDNDNKIHAQVAKEACQGGQSEPSAAG